MEENLVRCFPELESGIVPLDGQVVLQIIHVPEKSSGGILLAMQAQEDKQYAVKTAKIVAKGPTAFCNKLTGKPWAGMGIDVGDFVIAPAVSGVRFKKKLDKSDKNSPEIHFIACKDIQVEQKITNPFDFESIY